MGRIQTSKSTTSMVLYCNLQRSKYQRTNIEGEIRAKLMVVYRDGKHDNIKFKKAHDEKGSADNILFADDIYNADETGLFYRATPDGSVCYKTHCTGDKNGCLPVEYHANKIAWMTSEIVRNRLTSFHRTLKLKQRKRLLLVEYCAAHPHLDNLQNVQLELLPP
ncbi:hypothetical protein RF11_10884 [Thelohanellus kitauei]|uniref:DDE-1 domain-containing protein n=1 Tax=Thelohanellus kitauei TaxID=669202 RepID=A0A0C2MGJ3_THEKT|nr:hypothetical protein RF11_10884 [Thelohanellus kitauei]